LFKVPHLYFEHSFFDTVFTLPAAGGAPADGSDDEHPFKLEGIKRADFRAFLKLLSHDCPFRKPLISEEEWLAVLKLSTMWDFFDVRNLAIKVLSKVTMNPVTKVLLAREYNIQEWLLAGYDELAKRKETISLDEAEQLGKDTAIRLFQIREESLADFYTIRVVERDTSVLRVVKVTTEGHVGPFDRTGCECAEGIRKAFVEELKAVQELDENRRPRVL